VVIVAGSAVLVEDWHDRTGAILQTFYAGMEGGTALARLLFGAVSPGGKLPFTVARDPADYPPFDPDATEVTYGYWHGYALFDRSGAAPRYAFGHGLSYASFACRALTARITPEAIAVSIAVTNTGLVTADEVVQVYIGAPGQAAERPHKSLKAFQRITLAPGETRIAHLSVPLASLRWRDPASHQWRLEPGEYRVLAGGDPSQLIETRVSI
jgi:beta-glucosidase